MGIFSFFNKGPKSNPETEKSKPVEKNIGDDLKSEAEKEVSNDLTSLGEDVARKDDIFIKKFEALVAAKLADAEFVAKLKQKIANERVPDKFQEVKPLTEEEFQPGHGILEQHLKEKYGDDIKKESNT